MSLSERERQELEEELVESLARHGYCSVACQILHEFRPDAIPWVITDAENNTRDAHFFLYDGEYAIDIGGRYDIPFLTAIIDRTLVAQPTDWHRVRRHEKSLGMCREEKEIVERRFRKHIKSRPKTFGIAT